MLFNSYLFLFLFLPLTLAGYCVLSKQAGRRSAVGWLVLLSLAYYGWWNPKFLALIVASILVNFALGNVLARDTKPDEPGSGNKPVLLLGIVLNLGVLFYFKYANFFLDSLRAMGMDAGDARNIILPIGISFFTFQQIAYLVDTYKGTTGKYGLLEYSLFVTFFPQLIAGPIVHHKEMLPQFQKKTAGSFDSRQFGIGLTIFILGLAKKVLLADRAAAIASPVFDGAAAGDEPTMIMAWVGMVGYSLQLYFDFSGYSDMAIGLARMFGIRLPLNFNSPYKAINISDFWRRWHMTLSQFLRDYLYIPLGGNRCGKVRRYFNLMATMVLGGLWHGAGMTFIFWGFLHGLYLCVNHGWQAFRKGVLGHDLSKSTALGEWTGRLTTCFFAGIAWIFFRAVDFESAWRVLVGLFGMNGVDLAIASQMAGTFAFLGALSLVVLLAPNTQDLMARARPAWNFKRPSREALAARRLIWRPTPAWSLALTGMFVVSVLSLSELSEFIYYQF